MTATHALFVGGPAHGEVRPVPDGRPAIYVQPELPPVSLVASGGVEDYLPPEVPRPVTYARQTLALRWEEDRFTLYRCYVDGARPLDAYLALVQGLALHPDLGLAVIGYKPAPPRQEPAEPFDELARRVDALRGELRELSEAEAWEAGWECDAMRWVP